MNKKFSTLMLGLLLTSAFASAQGTGTPVLPEGFKQVTFDKNVVVSGTYFVVGEADNDGKLSGGDLLLKVENNDGTLTYTSMSMDEVDFFDKEELSTYTWSFEVKKEGSTAPQYFYALKNEKAGTYLTYDGTALEDEASKSQSAKKDLSLFYSGDEATAAWKNGDVLTAYSKGNKLDVTNLNLNAVGTKIYLCHVAETAVNALDLNNVKGGAGFNFTFSLDNKNEWANDILSDLNLKAFVVDGESGNNTNDAITWGTDNMFTIPAGIYFATEYPATLNNTNVISNKEDFLATTFLAIDPDVCNTTVAADRKNGIGFGLKTVKGSDMNVFTEQKDDQASVKGDVYVKNALFTVVQPDMLGKPEVYNIKATARLLTDASKTAHVEKTVYLGSLVASNKNYLATASEASKALALKTANTTLYDVTELLKSEDAPSIYTIQFVIELYKNEATNFAGEKGQYLTVALQGATPTMQLTSVVDIDATDPQYQFVITDVDKEAKTVTFANRQTRETVKVSLYKNEDGSYTVYNEDNESLYIESFDINEVNGDVKFDNYSEDHTVAYKLQGTKVILTPVTVEDKFASFVNRADDAGLVTFELAKNVDDTPAFYVGAKRDKDGDIEEVALRGYTSEKNMTQFELVKVYKDAKKNPWTVTNSYVYKNGSRVLTSTAQDTVAYYKYAIKVFGEERNYYVTNTYALSTTTPTVFIIKNNLDGSVSLIGNDLLEVDGSVNDDMNFAAVSATENNTAAWASEDYYNLPNVLNESLKTFMVGEDPVYSYEAVPQHVSFEAVRGGFLTKDENNDARLAIANVAAEDLTFWLDTVHSDQNIPSFYILKNGAFMYNAADSADYNIVNKERFEIDKVADKLIFKAGELVTSDTLRTMVDGQSVLVAEKDNAPLKIKGGLKNFQFQIVQSEKGSDEYVIRQLNGGYQYVCQVNNYLTLTDDKDAAYRFVIEKQAAPTANEGIEVSEVKVIAGNGQITIMGAAGKQVVVSNILGKVVANQMITTDNATIAVPAGIIAVAVEGEAAVKAIVK